MNVREISEVELVPNNIVQNIKHIKEEQEKDVDISEIMRCMRESEMRVISDDSKEVKGLKRCGKKLKLDKNGILVKCDKLNGRQIVLPKSMRPSIYEQLHVEIGHLGAERVLELARKKVFWPKMQEDIETFIREQCACIA